MCSLRIKYRLESNKTESSFSTGMSRLDFVYLGDYLFGIKVTDDTIGMCRINSAEKYD